MSWLARPETFEELITTSAMVVHKPVMQDFNKHSTCQYLRRPKVPRIQGLNWHHVGFERRIRQKLDDLFRFDVQFSETFNQRCSLETQKLSCFGFVAIASSQSV